MKLIELVKGTDIKLPDKTAEDEKKFYGLEIEGISSNSLEVAEGYLFICIKGMKSDGHRYIRDAVKNHALAVLTEEGCDFDFDFNDSQTIIHLTSGNTRRALAFIWNSWYGNPAKDMRLIAVTGTNGKTSLTFMLRAIFGAALVQTGLIGTVVCYSGDTRLDIRSADGTVNLTTPDPKELYRILSVMRDDGVGTVLLEASSHALALDKLAPLHFSAAVFTNLSPEHLDFHGDMKNYLEAKSKLFSMCDVAIINGDDKYSSDIQRAAENGGASRIRLCTTNDARRADYLAANIADLGVDGIEYILSSVCSVFKVNSPIPGRFTIMNTLEAAACALEMGVSPQNVRDALRHMGGIDGRFERVKLCSGAEFSVFIDYAHTPDALENLLLTVRSFRHRGERIVLLFGCGGDRDRGKRAVMGRIASELADFVIVTSDNSRSEEPSDIISDIMVGFDYSRAHAIVIENRAEAIDYAICNALRHDIILLAGKGHEEYEIDRNGKHPFSEKKIAEEAARKYYYYK